MRQWLVKPIPGIVWASVVIIMAHFVLSLGAYHALLALIESPLSAANWPVSPKVVTAAANVFLAPITGFSTPEHLIPSGKIPTVEGMALNSLLVGGVLSLVLVVLRMGWRAVRGRRGRAAEPADTAA